MLTTEMNGFFPSDFPSPAERLNLSRLAGSDGARPPALTVTVADARLLQASAASEAAFLAEPRIRAA